MVAKSQTVYTTIRISKTFHTWIFGKGMKGESYDDVLQRITGFEVVPGVPVESGSTVTITPIAPIPSPDPRVMYSE
jgi:hypothetical protein